MNEKTLFEIQKGLKKEIPFKWRVQSFSKTKPQATCVAYIDSRDVQDVLDANCLWSDRYYEENGMLFCEITIYADGREYKRSDTGSESQADKEKGHSSDAFKRAAVKFGVGRFLYNQKIQYVTANAKKENNYPYPVDRNGKRIWDLTTHINKVLGKSNNTDVPKNNTPVSSKSNNNDKPWLNKLDSNKNFSKEWLNVVEAINKDTIKDITQVREHYKVSKAVEAELQEVFNLKPVA